MLIEKVYGWIGATIVSELANFEILENGDRVVVSTPAFDGPASEDDFLKQESAMEAALSLPRSKAQGIEAISVYANRMRAQIAGTSDAQVMVGWATKLECAKAVLAGTATAPQAQTLALEAQTRVMGETPEALAQKVVSNADIFAMANGAIDGVQRSATDAVKAATTPEQVAQALAAADENAKAMFAQLFGG